MSFVLIEVNITGLDWTTLQDEGKGFRVRNYFLLNLAALNEYRSPRLLIFSSKSFKSTLMINNVDDVSESL